MAEGFQVIARRWRPQQFDEIVGQEHIVRTLKNAIQTGRIGHAYLFVGPRGTGKTTTARIFAKALNCTNGPSVSPPEDDPICRAIVEGSCPDVSEIDAATNRSVDDAKQIREECYYPPMQCRYKIYIVDEVHQLSKDAFNALLKVIEEPPPFVKFIFATTESDKVLETITSRCQRFEFQPISEEKIADRLAQITSADGVEADRAALIAIARLANGGMRDSQSILDQVISFCGKKITERDVSDIYGLASSQEIEELVSAMSRADYPGVIAFADKFVAEGRDLLRVLTHTQARVREALLDAIRGNGVSHLTGTPMRTEQLLRMLDALNAGETGVKFGLSERANFEVVLLKAVEQSRARAIDTLIREISSLAGSVPAVEEKKNELTRACEDALAATEDSAPSPGNYSTLAQRTAPAPVAPAKPAVPAEKVFAGTQKTAAPKPQKFTQKPAPRASRDADFSGEKQPPARRAVPVATGRAGASAPVAVIFDPEKVAAELETVSPEILKAADAHFGAKWTRYVPAGALVGTIFSAHGEISAPAGTATACAQSAPEGCGNDDAADDASVPDDDAPDSSSREQG